MTPNSGSAIGGAVSGLQSGANVSGAPVFACSSSRLIVDHLAHHEALRRHVDHRQIRVDPADAFHRRQRQRALFQQPRRALARHMLHDDAHLARAGGEIHRAADQRAAVGHAHVPVGEIAVRRDLERAEDRHVDMPAADHRERPRGVDDRGARPQGDAAAAGIDQIGVGLVLFRQGPDADHAVLRLEGDVDLRRQIVRAMHRQADAEIDHLAVGDVLRGAPGDLQAIERAHDTATTRST